MEVSLPDGSTFSLKCLEVICQVLEDDLEDFRACKDNGAPSLHSSHCRCGTKWSVTSYLLKLARDEPGQVTDVLCQYGWRAILEEPNFATDAKAMSHNTDDSAHPLDRQTFGVLHSTAICALRRDKGHAGARHLLKQLGTCHDLFRSVLRRIANDDVWTSVPSASWNQGGNADMPSSRVSC